VAKTPRRNGKAPDAPDPDELDPAQQALFREVDEDLRAERMRALWKQYGAYVIGAAVLVVAIVAGFQGWTAWQASVQADESRRYFQAVAGETLDRQALTDLAGDGRTGFAAMADLQAARDLAQAGDAVGAIAALDALSSDGTRPLPVRNVAAMLAALYALDVESAQAVRGRVSGLTAEDSPWRFMAREIMALSALNAGDEAEARRLFADLGNAPEAPPGVRARASELLALMGGGANDGANDGGGEEPSPTDQEG
jgi:hypothetical protein